MSHIIGMRPSIDERDGRGQVGYPILINNRHEKLSVRCGGWSLYVQRVFGRRVETVQSLG